MVPYLFIFISVSVSVCISFRGYQKLEMSSSDKVMVLSPRVALGDAARIPVEQESSWKAYSKSHMFAKSNYLLEDQDSTHIIDDSSPSVQSTTTTRASSEGRNELMLLKLEQKILQLEEANTYLVFERDLHARNAASMDDYVRSAHFTTYRY